MKKSSPESTNTDPIQSGDGATAEPPPRDQRRSLAEWISFGITSAILLAVVGLVGYLWRSQHKQEPPVLRVVSQAAPRQSAGQFYVPFSVTNTGGQTAESVQIIAELEIGGEVVESGEQQIDFLSSDEVEEGAFVFSQNPERGELVIRVASYKLP